MRRSATAVRVGAAVVLLAVLPLLAPSVASVASAVGPLAVPSPSGDATLDRTLQDSRITESSGLAVSAVHPGVVYTHNDSGDGPRLFAVGADGRTRAVLTLRGAPARDWEAVAPGRRGSRTLWVGDIGDNLASWPSIRVYRIEEPRTVRTQDVAWTRYDLRFEDGPHDAESLLVDPRTGRLYVASKQLGGAALYEAPAALSTAHVNVLHRVGSALPYATDGAFSPDGRWYVLRGYVGAEVYRTDRPGRVVARIDLPAQPQGESVAWSPDGRSLLVGSEGVGSAVYRVPLPAAVTAAVARTAQLSPSQSPTATPSVSPSALQPSGGGADRDGSGLPRRQVLWLGAAALVLIALGFSLRSWSKRDEQDERD